MDDTKLRPAAATTVLALALATLLTFSARADNWPAWRGSRAPASPPTNRTSH